MFYMIVLLGILGLIGTDLFVPSLPAIAQHFQQSPNHTQLTISLFLAGFAFSQLFYGPISDKTGRKAPLLFGVSIFVIGSLICTGTNSFTWLCIGRMIQGLGVGSGLSLARVIIRDCYHGTELAVKTSQLAIFISLTPAIAPVLGGFLQQHFGFRASFSFMLGYGILLLLLLLTRFKETIQHREHQLTLHSTLHNYGRLLKNMTFIRYVIMSGLAFSSIVLYANIMPFIIQTQLHLSASDNGIIILIAAIGISTGSFISSRTVRFYSSTKFVRLGLLILTSSGLLLIITQYLFGTTLFCLIPLLFFITIACGFIFPNALALCFAQINVNIGIAGAIYGTLQITISTIVNLLLNTVSEQGQSVMGLFYLGIGLFGLSLLLLKKYDMEKLKSENKAA